MIDEVLTNNIYFAYIWNFDCPVQGEMHPLPFYHLGSKCIVPQKCIFCPYLFEGECVWARNYEKRKSFILKITSAVQFEENALQKAFKDVMDQFILSSEAIRLLLIIDGDFSRMTLWDIHQIVEEFNSIYLEYSDKCLVNIFPGTFGGIRVSIVQEFCI